MSKRADEMQAEDSLLNKAGIIATVFEQPVNAGMSPLQEALLQNLSEEFEERKKKRESDKDAVIRMNENSRRNAELFTAKQALQQRQCPHKQPKGESNVRGQYLSNGYLHLRCQRCQKAWNFPADEQTFPADLWPSGDDIGGPNMNFNFRSIPQEN